MQHAAFEPLPDFADRARGVVGIGEVDLDVVFRPARPTGSSPGKGWREQVSTRQPALEKRITVAWPMPRLAPVRSSVRRGRLEVGIEWFFRSSPGLVRAPVFNSVA